MADLAAVEEGFVNLISTILFGDTPYVHYDMQSSPTLGANVRLYRGWPISNQLSSDLRAGISNISVFSSPSVAKNATRYLKQMAQTAVSKADPTMTATLSANHITFGGTGSTTQVIGVRSAKFHGYAYRLLSSDTPTTVAAIFAGQLPGSSSAGSVLTLTGNSQYYRVDIGTDTTVLTEVHRQVQMIQVTIWCPTVGLRDQLANLIDPNLMNTDHMFFAEGSVSGPIIGAGTNVNDVVQNDNMWMRTLFYLIEYPTMLAEMVPTMVLGQENFGPLTFID